jgi:hypothetical protein
LLGRDMDADGSAYWKNLDATTNLTDEQLQTQFMQGVDAELAKNQQTAYRDNFISDYNAQNEGATRYDGRQAYRATQGRGDMGGRGQFGGSGSLGSNPYLSAQADAIKQASTDAFGQMNNMITSNSVGTGGLGGTRQGVAQGVAQGQIQNSMQANLANLYGNAYNADQNRDLQRYGIDTNSAIQNKSLDNNFFLGNNAQRDAFYNANRGMDITQLGIGSDLFSNTLRTVAGNSGTNNLSSGDGGWDWQKAIGGILAGTSFGKDMGWWGSK